MKTGIFIMLGLVALISPASANAENPGVCPMDAQICPDGSAVFREGPHCVFASCAGDKSQRIIPSTDRAPPPSFDDSDKQPGTAPQSASGSAPHS